ncbi:hypothetical protein ACFFRR_004608 [Megaselia abdita]
MEAVTINRTKLQPVSGEKIPLLNLTCPLDRKDIPLNKNWSKRPWTIPTSYPEFVDRALDFKVRYDDIWILGQQKTGTTWMQDMAWLITHNFDFKTSENSHVYERSVNLEYTGVYQPFAGTEAEKKGVSSFAATENMTSPRIIKSHLSPNMLPKELWTKKPKVIYLTRNVKDSAVSLYHMYKGLKYFDGTKEQFLDALMTDSLAYCPYWPHILEFWEMRNESNIFFISYERIKRDLRGSFKEISEFLENPCSDDILDKAVDHLSFQSMKNSKAGQTLQKIMEDIHGTSGEFKFIRRGEIGSHKDELPEGYSEKMDNWSERSLVGSGVAMDDILSFSYK